MALKINKVIRTLILSDLMLWSAFGLILPIFAIFITEQIQGGDIKVAGFAVAMYWIPKSLLQIPIGMYLDKNRGEKDDFYFLVFGTILAALVPFGFIFSHLPWHIYGLQIIKAIGMACAIPPWLAIFTRHIDKGKEAFEWSVETTASSLGIGIAGALGGITAARYGFNNLFIAVGVLAVLGGLVLIFIYKSIALKIKEKVIPKIKKPPAEG